MSCGFKSHLADTTINAGVTQLVEYHTFNMGVVGSSPATRTKTLTGVRSQQTVRDRMIK